MTEKFFKKKPEFDKSPIAGIQYEDNKTKNGEIVANLLKSNLGRTSHRQTRI